MGLWQVCPAFHSIFRHEKKVLALVLAFACAFTMFAGAAFTDAADISDVNADAVELLSALNIIQGDPDGSFAPEREVTRAEMAKMIYTIRNGGNDDASAYETVTTSFTDISGHWAEGYIKYLQNTGIVAGKSAYIFDPDSTVTTGEAMKMALVLAGYRADKAELTGTNWLNNTVSRATTVGMTKNVQSSIAGGCTRQDAAQILSNTLTEVYAVAWSDFTTSFVFDGVQGLATGNRQTVGQKWLDLYVFVGRMTSSGDLKVDNNLSSAAGKDQFIVDVDTVNGDAYAPGGSTNVTFKDGKDHTDLVGQEVKVVRGKNYDDVYGVYATGTSNVVETTMDMVEVQSNWKVKVDGTTYNTIGALVYTDGADGDPISTPTTFTADSEKVADSVKLIDWDDNGTYETVITKTVAVAEVNYVGSSNITIGTPGSRYIGFLNSNNSFSFDDDTIYEGVAKGDYAVITKNLYNSNYVVEKAETVEGTVNGLVENERKVRVDGTWYTLANDNGTSHTLYTIAGTREAFTNGDKVTLVVVGNIAYYAKSASGNDANRSVLMVYGKKATGGAWNDTPQAKVILADGTKKTVDIASTGVQVGSLQVGQMYSYEVNNDGEYIMTAIVDGTESTLAGYDHAYDTAGITKGKIDADNGTDYAIADDAVVFALIDGDDAKVYTGKQIKDAASNTSNYGDKTANGTIDVSSATLQALISTEGGFTYARMFNIELDNELNNIVNYGYLLEDAVKSKTEANTMEYTLWNGTEVLNVTESTDTNKTYLKTGALISYTLDGEGMVKDVRAVTTAKDGLTYAAITAADGNKIAIRKMVSGAPVEDVIEADGDTIAIYVDSQKNNTEDRTITTSGYNFIAGYDANDNNYVNAAFVMNDAGDKVAFILIDVDGRLKDAGIVEADDAKRLVATEAAGNADSMTFGGSATLTYSVEAQNYTTTDSDVTLSIEVSGGTDNSTGISSSPVNIDMSTSDFDQDVSVAFAAGAHADTYTITVKAGTEVLLTDTFTVNPADVTIAAITTSDDTVINASGAPITTKTVGDVKGAYQTSGILNADVDISVQLSGGVNVADTKALTTGDMIVVTVKITPDADYKLADNATAPTLKGVAAATTAIVDGAMVATYNLTVAAS